MTVREEAEKLARQVYHCDMRFDACSYCQDSIDDIESALREAEQRALREAADELAYADIYELPVPPEFTKAWEKADRQLDDEARSRIMAVAWLRKRADAKG